jgi:iron complex outermembrane receptor protein
MVKLIANSLVAVSVALLLNPALDASAQGARGQLDEIIVTARKREETQQTVPVTLSTFGAQLLELQQVVELQDLHLGIPNVTIVRNTGTNTGAQVFVRGVGQDDSAFTNEPTIGIYVDDVYIGRQIGAMIDLLDVERVEVLRGPQGTLYGRNSTGGAIKFVSARPDPSEFSARAGVTVGSYDRLDVAGVINVPLVDDTLALRVSGLSRDQRGWVKIVDAANVETGQRANAIDSRAARALLRWLPSDSLTVDFGIDMAQDTSGPNQLIPTNCAGVNALLVACPLRFGEGRAGINVPDINRFRGQGGNLAVTWDQQGYTVRSITAYRSFTDDLAVDLTSNPAFVFNLLQDLKQRQISQELQLNSANDGPLNWLVGAFGFREEVDQDAVFTGNRNIDEQTSTSYAVFGEVGYDLMPGLSVTVGARYSRDRKTIEREFFAPGATAPTQVLNSASVLPNRLSNTEFTPRIAVDYQLADDQLVYASFSQGYKPSGFAAARPVSAEQLAAVVDTEKVDSWELGYKSQWMDNRVRANVAAFHSTYDNLQLSILSGDGSFFVDSADVRFWGLELDTAFQATENLFFYAIAGYLNDKYKTLPATVPTADRLKHAPKFHYKVGTEYRAGVGQGMEFFVGANWLWTDEIIRNVANTANITTPSYGLVDAQLGLEGADGRWRLTAGGENLADKDHWVQGISTLGRYYGMPRTLFLKLDTRF